MKTATIDLPPVRRWKRYPEYKDSGIACLGDIPAHWDALRLKWAVSKIGSGKTPRGGGEVYCDSGVLFLRSQNVHFNGLRLDDVVFIDEATDSEMSSTRVMPGDVLLNITGASLGRCCVVPGEIPKANVNQHVCILRPRPSLVFTNYLGAWISSPSIQSQIFSSENGVSREGLNYTQTANLVFAKPPHLKEQWAIAAFLDRETLRIDALIGHKKRLIELLEEKRQAVISLAVTRGLNSIAPLKDSGVPWLGMKPKHWQTMRLKFLLSTPIEQGWSPVCDNRMAGDDEWAVLKVGCVNGHDFDPTEHKTLPDGVPPDTRWQVRPGDLLMSRGNTRELVGSAALVSEVGPRVLLCDLLYRFGLRSSRADPDFVVRSLRSRYVRDQIESRAEGASPSMRKISQDDIKELVLALPPIDEQRQIATELKSSMRKVDESTGRIRESIAHLQEYRTALISAAVTGQIDVRGEVTQ